MTFNNGAPKIPLDYLEQGHDITPCDNKIPILSKWQNKVIKKMNGMTNIFHIILV